MASTTTITISDWLVITATLAGPILAVQAQKWIERVRDVSNRREFVFGTLMATRGIRLHPDHVRALNMIGMAYYGPTHFGKSFRSAKAQGVLDAWREYHHHLGRSTTDFTEAQLETHWSARDSKYVSLLAAMASERGFAFDRVELEDGGYHPQGVGQAEVEANLVRKLAAELLGGERGIRVIVEEPAAVGAPLR